MESEKHSPIDTEEQNDSSQESPSKFKKWFKRVGIAGFLFFLIKGLIWLVVIFWAGKCAVD